MNKTTLVEAVAAKTNLKKKEADAAVNAVIEAITEELATGGKVQIVGFGTFKVKERPERVGRNPATKQAITIPASKVPAFAAGAELKKSVNK